MSGRVGIDLESRRRVEIIGWLQQPSARRHHFFVRRADVLDEQVEMELLRGAVGPLRRSVIRGQLYADARPPVGVIHAVPVVLGLDPAAEQAGPERTFGADIRSVEHDDLSGDVHTGDRDRTVRQRHRAVPRYARRAAPGQRPNRPSSVAVASPCPETAARTSSAVPSAPTSSGASTATSVKK